MIRWIRRLVAASGIKEEAQNGVAIVLVAISMVVLIGFAAFSVDFGWLYLNGVRIQHGADAAALAGVVYEPGDQTTAYAEARSSAAENGYNDSAAGTTVTPLDYADDPSAVENQYQLSVEIEHSVDTFFMKIFGIDSIAINKRAVAEYVLPLPMGSDLPYFGEDPSIPGREPHFWANIHGYYTGRRMGDRFSSQCVDGGAGSSCAPNPDRRPTTYAGGIPVSGGYLYGIELAPGASNLGVDVFDGPFYEGGGDGWLVGDNPQGTADGPTTWFILYAPDPTPLNTTDNEVLCAWSYASQPSFADFNGDNYINNGDDQDGDGDLDWDDVEMGLPGGVASLWDRICGTTFDRGAGVYPLRVVVDSGDNRGLNRYALRASTTGTQPRFYGLGDMAVYVNFDGNTSTFNLAEVQDVHAGKDLVIELWDPDSGNNGVQIFMPDSTSPPCDWTNLDGSRGASLGTCDINFSTGFDNDHMQIRVHIPETYVCSANCWWTIEVSYPGGANDTTTWSARIEGNPVALVE